MVQRVLEAHSLQMPQGKIIKKLERSRCYRKQMRRVQQIPLTVQGYVKIFRNYVCWLGLNKFSGAHIERASMYHGKNEDDLKNEDKLKNEEDHKNEDDIKNEDIVKNEDDLKKGGDQKN